MSLGLVDPFSNPYMTVEVFLYEVRKFLSSIYKRNTDWSNELRSSKMLAVCVIVYFMAEHDKVKKKN